MKSLFFTKRKIRQNVNRKEKEPPTAALFPEQKRRKT